MTQFSGGFFRFMHRQHRDTFEARVDFAVAIVEPIVVRSGNDTGPIGILYQSEGKPRRRVENSGIQFRFFDKPDPHICRSLAYLVQTADKTPWPPVERREDGKDAR